MDILRVNIIANCKLRHHYRKAITLITETNGNATINVIQLSLS